MIPVKPAREPASFDACVRQRGATAIARLLGQPVKGSCRKPTKIYAKPEDVPADRFPVCWTDVRQTDGKSALDDMMQVYGQICAYLGLYIENATGSPTVDHFVPKQRDWRWVYEWSNYRLSASCVNGAKGVLEMVDPFVVQSGWFELDLDTFVARIGKQAPPAEKARIERTLPMLSFRQCVRQRGQYISLYRQGVLGWGEVQRRAPFIAYEMCRQGAVAAQFVGRIQT